MYNFIDVNQVSEGALLPSEALNINGAYIEDLIPGYRTLHVSGREALSPDVTSFQTGVRDGSSLKNKRYPERIIIVTYQLTAATSEEFREAYNKLGGILDVKDAKLIFNDEQDKFFVGTPCIIGSVPPGRNAVVGKFEILCVDPFKYSVIEYEAEPDLTEGSALIDYNGTYKAFPTLVAEFYNENEASEDGETEVALTGSGDCGYVAFFNESEKIVQLGDPEEVDGEVAYAKSQTLVSSTFNNSSSWGTAAKKQWSVNSIPTPYPIAFTQTGLPGIGVASNAVTETPASTSATLLTATSTADTPPVKYTVTAKATNRTATTVKVTLSITASLARSGNYWHNAGVLVASVYIWGKWHDVTMKNASDKWNGTSGHTKNITVTAGGISETTSGIGGIKFKAYRKDNLGNAGVLSETDCGLMPISKYVASTPATYYLTASSYGTGSLWHGTTISRAIPPDASGVVGAENFIFTYKQKMCIGNSTSATKQLGGFHVNLTSSDGKVVAGVRVVKNQAGQTASLMLFINGVKVHQVGIILSYSNKLLGAGASSVGTSTIRKSGSTIVFNIGGYRQTFTVDAVAAAKVTKITFGFEQYGSAATLSHNGLYYAKFTKDNCNTYKDIPNKFSANDVVEADCKNGEIFLNGISTPSLGALGNDWEGFYLTPGLNQIGFAFSDWVDAAHAPTFKVRYREVFL